MTRRRNLPPMNALAAFEAAARLGGFSRAAAEMGVAQPAISRHVAVLEDALGVSLFHRAGNRVSLTEEGRTLAEPLTAALDRIELTAGRLNRAKRNKVVIGASFGMAHMWLMPRISQLRDAAGGVLVNVITSDDYADFDSPGVDLSIRFGNGDWPGKVAEPVTPEVVQPISAPEFLADHPELANGVNPERIDPEWLLHHEDPLSRGWVTWEFWFKAHDQRPPLIAAPRSVQNFPSLLDMVRAGEGVALGMIGLDDHLVATGEIVRIGAPFRRPGYGYYIICEPDSLTAPTVCAMRDAIIANAATDPAGAI